MSVDDAVGVVGADDDDEGEMREAADIMARGEKAGFNHGEAVMGGEEAIPDAKASLRFKPGGLGQDVDGEDGGVCESDEEDMLVVVVMVLSKTCAE